MEGRGAVEEGKRSVEAHRRKMEGLYDDSYGEVEGEVSEDEM